MYILSCMYPLLPARAFRYRKSLTKFSHRRRMINLRSLTNWRVPHSCATEVRAIGDSDCLERRRAMADEASSSESQDEPQALPDSSRGVGETAISGAHADDDKDLPRHEPNSEQKDTENLPYVSVDSSAGQLEPKGAHILVQNGVTPSLEDHMKSNASRRGIESGRSPDVPAENDAVNAPDVISRHHAALRDAVRTGRSRCPPCCCRCV